MQPRTEWPRQHGYVMRGSLALVALTLALSGCMTAVKHTPGLDYVGASVVLPDPRTLPTATQIVGAPVYFGTLGGFYPGGWKALTEQRQRMGTRVWCGLTYGWLSDSPDSPLACQPKHKYVH